VPEENIPLKAAIFKYIAARKRLNYKTSKQAGD